MKQARRVRDKAVALISGGLDSTVSLALAQKKGLKIRLGLTFDYGQKAARPEIRSARRICRKLKIPHRVVRLDWLKKIARSSSLVARDKVLPELKISELSDLRITKRTGRQVWVPNRNAVFIGIAAAFAESLHCSYIITGFNREEARTFPD
ncbi:MAG: 7-cyano-7-deazaguanine synthase, partial [Planctomycetota bacterium]